MCVRVYVVSFILCVFVCDCVWYGFAFMRFAVFYKTTWQLMFYIIVSECHFYFVLFLTLKQPQRKSQIILIMLLYPTFSLTGSAGEARQEMEWRQQLGQLKKSSSWLKKWNLTHFIFYYSYKRILRHFNIWSYQINGMNKSGKIQAGNECFQLGKSFHVVFGKVLTV